MTPLPPNFWDIFSTLAMGCWSFLGGIMRGADWKTPEGRFSPARFGASVATALVLGEIASAIGQHMHMEPAAVGALSGCVGYLGPAATMQFFQKRFFGGVDAGVKPTAND